jgi:hypothetical protein
MIASDYPERVPTSAITLTYVCGDKFRVSNSGAFWIEVSYRVQNTTETGEFSVGPQSFRDLVTENTGLVILSYMGQDIRERANAGVPCS